MTRLALVTSLSLCAVFVGCDCRSGPNGDAADRSRSGTREESPPTAPSTSPATGPSASAGSRPAATTTRSQAPAEAGAPEKLFGTWVGHDVSTAAAGDVKIQVTFRQEGPVKIMAWSELPFVGKVREKTGPYEVHGNTITSEAIRGGTSVQYWFDGGDLIIKYSDGKTVRLQRKK